MSADAMPYQGFDGVIGHGLENGIQGGIQLSTYPMAFDILARVCLARNRPLVVLVCLGVPQDLGQRLCPVGGGALQQSRDRCPNHRLELVPAGWSVSQMSTHLCFRSAAHVKVTEMHRQGAIAIPRE